MRIYILYDCNMQRRGVFESQRGAVDYIEACNDSTPELIQGPVMRNTIRYKCGVYLYHVEEINVEKEQPRLSVSEKDILRNAIDRVRQSIKDRYPTASVADYNKLIAPYIKL